MYDTNFIKILFTFMSTCVNGPINTYYFSKPFDIIFHISLRCT